MVRRWAALSLGQSHSAGVGGEGEAFTWGSNTRGQLGCSAGEPRDVPTKMDILRGWDVQAISCGGEHTIALTQEDVISWGANSEGQCGQGERAEQTYVKLRSIKPLQVRSMCKKEGSWQEAGGHVTGSASSLGYLAVNTACPPSERALCWAGQALQQLAASKCNLGN